MWQTRSRVEAGRGSLESANVLPPGAERAADQGPSESRVHVDDPAARRLLSRAILSHLSTHSPAPSPVTVVCIGSDRSTGDALGPLVGSRLKRIAPAGVHVRGTLEQPVHAANLLDHLDRLKREPADRVIVAIDACLGKTENVGTVSIKPGPLKPGTGVNKTLPCIGKFHIIGVVNVGGFMEYFVLQNTRLNLVMRLADLIAESLADCLARHSKPDGASQIAVTIDS